MKSVIIIGGGVIGLATGWQLLKKNISVTLFEEHLVGSGASFAAAGMITPTSEVKFGEEPLLKLFLESASLYPQFIRDLSADSQTSPDYQNKGSLLIALDEDDQADLDRLFDYQQELSLPVKKITSAQIKELEPNLSHQVLEGILAPHESFLDNRAFVTALKEAFLKKGGVLFEETPVQNLIIKNETVLGIKTAQKDFLADHVILATGTGKLAATFLPARGQIRPVKGQALMVMSPTPPFSHAIRTIHRYPVYLVPRSDGRVVIGATMEEMGSDDKVTAGAQLDLIYGAWKIWPGIYEAPVLETWVGHRPAARDHAPLIGPSSYKNLSLALGLFRHGILLTPLVAKLLAEWIADEKDSSYFDYFGYKRFLE